MKYQPLIGTDMSGSVGGVTASRNTYGSYFRKKVSPVNPNTPAQNAQRSAFTIVSQAFRTAGNSVALAFNSAATALVTSGSAGTTNVLTGQALFISINTMRQKAGLPLLYTPPTDPTPPGFSLPTVDSVPGGGLQISFAADSWNVSGGCVSIQISRLITPSQVYVGTYGSLGTIESPTSTPANFVPPVGLVDGGTYQLKYRVQTPDGRMSNYITQQFTYASATVTLSSADATGGYVLSHVALLRAGDIITVDTTASVNLVIGVTGFYQVDAGTWSGTATTGDTFSSAAGCAPVIDPASTGVLS